MHILGSVAVVVVGFCAASASAQITVLATGSGTSSDSTYTTNELGNFSPPAGTDKLVVALNDEENGFASAATYNGAAMSRVLDRIGNRYVTFFYLDYETAPTGGNLVFGGGGNDSAVAIYALEGTAKGYSAKAGIGSGTSIDFDALFDGSFVAVGLTYDGTNGTGQVVPPLIPMIEDTTMGVGGASFVSGYTTNVAAGTNTYSFVSTLNGGVAAVAFAAAGADNIVPAIISTSASDDVGNPTNSLLTDAVFTFTFDESIFPGSGNIFLVESGGATSQTFNVTNSTKLSFIAATLTITPDVLDSDTSYYFQIPSGAVVDGNGNTTNYPDNTLVFTTGPWYSLARDVQSTYSTNDLRNFDPSGYDKLIIIAMAEKSTFPSSVAWGSSNMTLVAQNANGNQKVCMWYLDGPFSGPESVTVGGGGYAISLLALQGTDPGFLAFTNASSESVDFLTTSDESFVVAGYESNSGTPVANDPLDTYFSRWTGNAYGACGALANTNQSLQSFSFTTPNGPSTVIVEFQITPPPAGTVLIIR